MKRIDAQDAARKAMELAAAEIDRLAASAQVPGPDGKPRGLVKFEGFDLQRYADVCLRYDDHILKWLAKMDPSSLNDELLRRVIAATEAGEADGAQRKPRKARAGA